MSSSYLDDFLGSVSGLPADLQRTLSTIRELDEASQELQKTMAGGFEELADKSSKGAKKGGAAMVIADEIQQASELALSLADEKIALATQAYDLIDNQVRRLDQDRKRFEVELRAAGIDIDEFAPPANTTSQGRKRASGGGSGASGGRAPGDLPIDPFEPVYCLCRQVAFGDMIACDNPQCLLEWFHYQCVGLTHHPKNSWFCPDCTAKRKRAARAAKSSQH